MAVPIPPPPHSTRVWEELKKEVFKNAEKANETITEEMLFPYRMYHLTPAMEKEARMVLKETEENKSKALKELAQLVENEPHLLCPTDDNFLLMFLRARKFEVKRAFNLIQNYWRFRKDHPEIYENVDVEVTTSLILKNYFGFLPFRDREGCIVAIIKVGKWDPEVDTVVECFRAATGILMHSIQFPPTQVMGYRLILDARELSWTQMKMATLSNMLLVRESGAYCFPGRYRAFHVLSENKLFNFAYNLIYPFVPSKYKKKIIIHGKDISGLRDYIHPSVLPDEFGGYAGPYDNTRFKETILSDRGHILKLLNYGYKN